MSTRVVIDRVRCDGRGVCAELFPELITLDDWGYPIVAGGVVPEHLLPVARLAVSSCPVLALRLAVVAAKSEAAAPLSTADSQPQVTVL